MTWPSMRVFLVVSLGSLAPAFALLGEVEQKYATKKPDRQRAQDLRLREVEDLRASRGISTISATASAFAITSTS